MDQGDVTDGGQENHDDFVQVVLDNVLSIGVFPTTLFVVFEGLFNYLCEAFADLVLGLVCDEEDIEHQEENAVYLGIWVLLDGGFTFTPIVVLEALDLGRDLVEDERWEDEIGSYYYLVVSFNA